MAAALIVIDVQQGFFRPAPAPALADRLFTHINELAARARAANAPVIFVQHETAAGRLAHGTPDWALATQLHVEPTDRTLRKTTPDSFLRTDLERLLAASGISQLVICGYATEFCVDTTVRRAAALGYEVTLAADAHTTHDKPHADAAQIVAHHNATLPSIVSFGSRIRAIAADEIRF